MSADHIHDFGLVDGSGDLFEFHWFNDKIDRCRLDLIIQTERGPQRRELAEIPGSIWRLVNRRVVRELVAGMEKSERIPRRIPNLKTGTNRLSPMIGRELAVLLWALMEGGAEQNIEAILHGWRELAREERWWLYAKGVAPGQRPGAGWRRALFHALAETSESRATEPLLPQEKKSPGSGCRSRKKQPTLPLASALKPKKISSPRPKIGKTVARPTALNN